MELPVTKSNCLVFVSRECLQLWANWNCGEHLPWPSLGVKTTLATDRAFHSSLVWTGIGNAGPYTHIICDRGNPSDLHRKLFDLLERQELALWVSPLNDLLDRCVNMLWGIVGRKEKF